MPQQCIFYGPKGDRLCWEQPDFDLPPGFPPEWFDPPSRHPPKYPRQPPPPAPPPVPRVPELGRLGYAESYPALSITPRGGPSVADRPSPASSPFVLGSPAPSAPPTPRRRRRRTRRANPPPRRRTAPTRRQPIFTPAPEAPATTPRPRVRPSVLPNIGDIPTSVPGALIDLWRGLLDEYLRPRKRPSPGGGPRRGGKRRFRPPIDPVTPGTVLNPATVPRPTPQPAPAPVPSPQESIFDQPQPSLGYDPYSTNPWPNSQPAKAPATRPRSTPRSIFNAPLSALRSLTQRIKSQPKRPGRRRQPGERNTQTRELGRLGQIGDFVQPTVSRTPNLTPFQRGVLDLPPQTSSDPCAVKARDARRRQRRRRKECTKWVTKEIRVCQSSNVK